MARIDWTMIFVDAPGFRPTAVDAPMPINPTPIAVPSAARPTCKLPVICIVLSFVRAPAARRRYAAGDSSVRRARRRLFVLTDEQREDCRQQHEHHRLHQADQKLHEVEGD